LVDKLIDRSFDSLIDIVKRGTSYHYNRIHVCIFYHIETTISIQLTNPINIVYNKIEITLVHLHVSVIKSSINIASKE